MRLLDVTGRWSKAASLAAAGLAALLIALADWFIKPEISLGFLYVFPILLLARQVEGQSVFFLGVILALVDVSLTDLQLWAKVTRFALTAVALGGTGLYARETWRNRQLLRESEEQLRILFESTPAAILVCDDRGNVLNRNRAAARLLGETATGSPISRYLPELSSLGGKLQLQTSVESELHCPDGRQLAVEVSFSTYSTSSGPRLAVILVELGDREDPADGLREIRVLLDDVAGRIERWTAANANGPVPLLDTPNSTFEPSDREVQILRLLLNGATNKEIASQLDLSESTVKANLQQLYTKARVRTRSQLVRYALENLRGRL